MMVSFNHGTLFCASKGDGGCFLPELSATVSALKHFYLFLCSFSVLKSEWP